MIDLRSCLAEGDTLRGYEIHANNFFGTPQPT
jgi:hypothetical protein